MSEISQETEKRLIVEEGDDAAFAEIQKQIGSFDDEATADTGDVDSLLSELQDEYDDFMAMLDADPTDPQYAKGEALWVGLDAEWVFDSVTQRNHILSIQLFVPSQEAITSDTKKRVNVDRLSRLIVASSGAVKDRPPLKANLIRLIDDALAGQLIADAPKLIFVVGFGLRFDLAALGDFDDLKTQIDSVSGKIATVNADSSFEFSRTLMTGDFDVPTRIGLRFIDVAAHVPPGTSLRVIGKQLGLEKLDIPKPYSIERMDEYLREQPVEFKKYAMRDAEIAVIYAQRLANFAKTQLGINRLPPTASGLALKWCMKTLKEAHIDPLSAFGLHRVRYEAYHNPTKKLRTFREVEPTPMRRIQEAFLTDCYAGGRNESFYIGPSPIDHWRDFDLAGAYSSGLMDLPLIDFERPKASAHVNDFLEHVAGYALIEFKHPPQTRFPVFAISKGSRGLIFPLEGTAYASAPEIRAAHDLGCVINIRWGVIFPWKLLEGDHLVNGVPSIRLFRPFVIAARKLRHQLKQANGGKDTLESLAAKLYANSVYGKIAQSLRPKNVFDTRQVRSIKLKPSPITNPAIAAHVTGLIRGILAEILNRIPEHRSVLSVTTDGFITNATEDEIDLSGPLCRRFQALCDEIARELVTKDGLVPAIPMLEIKHEVAQVICMKTRGQLTGKALNDEEIVLARAGVQVVVDAPSNLPPESYKRLQNEAMLDLYLTRTADTKTSLHQFPSIRDQWEKGIDLHKFVRQIRLSLEPDLKRCPVPIDTPMVQVADHGVRHIALTTRPWKNEGEFEATRAVMDGWRRNYCLRTEEDWQTLELAIAMSDIRLESQAAGESTLNLRAGQPPWDLLRRAFLRAYAHQALGLTRVMTYRELASWLSAGGVYMTTKTEAGSARGREVLLGKVPRIPAMMPLFEFLKNRFPEAELDRKGSINPNLVETVWELQASRI